MKVRANSEQAVCQDRGPAPRPPREKPQPCPLGGSAPHDSPSRAPITPNRSLRVDPPSLPPRYGPKPGASSRPDGAPIALSSHPSPPPHPPPRPTPAALAESLILANTNALLKSVGVAAKPISRFAELRKSGERARKKRGFGARRVLVAFSSLTQPCNVVITSSSVSSLHSSPVGQPQACSSPSSRPCSRSVSRASFASPAT